MFSIPVPVNRCTCSQVISSALQCRTDGSDQAALHTEHSPPFFLNGYLDKESPFSADILVAITTCKETLTAKIDFLSTDISLIHNDLDKFRSRVSEAEDRISVVEDAVRSDSCRLSSYRSIRWRSEPFTLKPGGTTTASWAFQRRLRGPSL